MRFFTKQRAAGPGGGLASLADRIRELQGAGVHATTLASFDAAELDVVRVDHVQRSGLTRVSLGGANAPAKADRQAARQRLEEQGFLRIGPPRSTNGHGPPTELAALLTDEDGHEGDQVVTLYGDYALVSALRSSPALVLDVRGHPTGTGGLGFAPLTVYMGCRPAVELQEVAVDGRLQYRLVAGGELLRNLLSWFGMQDGPDPEWPEDLDEAADLAAKEQASQEMPPPRPVAEVVAGSTVCTELRVARPRSGGVEVTTVIGGVDEEGLWTAERMDPAAPARRSLPLWQSVRIASMIEPEPPTDSWWPGGVAGY